jgi:hypothetical protein
VSVAWHRRATAAGVALALDRAMGEPQDITAAVDLSRDVTWLLAGLLVLAGAAGAFAGRRRCAITP